MGHFVTTRQLLADLFVREDIEGDTTGWFVLYCLVFLRKEDVSRAVEQCREQSASDLNDNFRETAVFEVPVVSLVD